MTAGSALAVVALVGVALAPTFGWFVTAWAVAGVAMSAVLYPPAFAALTRSHGARAYYDDHRASGATHHQALRALANRLVGILDGCLRHRTTYDEATAWAHREPAAA